MNRGVLGTSAARHICVDRPIVRRQAYLSSRPSVQKGNLIADQYHRICALRRHSLRLQCQAAKDPEPSAGSESNVKDSQAAVQPPTGQEAAAHNVDAIVQPLTSVGPVQPEADVAALAASAEAAQHIQATTQSHTDTQVPSNSPTIAQPEPIMVEVAADVHSTMQVNSSSTSAADGSQVAADAADTPNDSNAPTSKALAWTFAPGTLFMFLSVLPPGLFLVHRLLVTVLQLTVFVICNVVFSDHAIPPLMWRNVCQSCLETSSLLDQLVPVVLLALAGIQQGLMDLCSGLFRVLLLAPVLIPAAVAATAAVQSPEFRVQVAELGQKVPQKAHDIGGAAVDKVRGAWAALSSKVPASWGERAAGAWRSLCTPAAQQLLLQGSILLMTGWLASVFTEPLRPNARMGTVSLILFILLRIATFFIDVAVLREMWGSMRTSMKGEGTLSHWVSTNQKVVRLAIARAACELMWALAIGLRFMYGITTGWKVMVALYLLWFASSTWQLTQEQASAWPAGSWGILATHAVMALIVSWPLCLPGWEALPELGIVHRGSHGFWGSL